MGQVYGLLVELMLDMLQFAEQASGIRLRSYQREVAKAITESVVEEKGLTFVVIFPRQSGKNELQAQIETYLLTVLSKFEAEMVKVSPTGKPQAQIAMRRLERVLKKNALTRDKWKREGSYTYRINQARIYFLSGAPRANVVGTTASKLLECDEAQDVLTTKWDKDFAPMAASTNATRVFWGTMWTSRTLLARELADALEAEKQDGERRVFVINADEVAKEVPAYGKFVAEQVARLGRNHPLIKTQFYSEMIDQEGGMFPDRRLALMMGSHHRRLEPEPGKVYALLIDMAGEDEGAADIDTTASRRMYNGTAIEQLTNPMRDSTTLTIVECDLSTIEKSAINAPTYKVTYRESWLGTKHSTLFGHIRAIAGAWNARYLVIDSMGVGVGLASFLAKALPSQTLPFQINRQNKSKLGWAFLSIVETGRFQDYKSICTDKEEFFEQLRHCQMEILPGPERHMKWGVPDGTRNNLTGELVHDDWILSAALTAVLDEQEWFVKGAPVILKGRDPLVEMDREGF